MTSTTVMWAATTNHVWRSSDRGIHWTNVSPEGRISGHLFALSDQSAWVVTQPANSQSSLIARTTDGGLDWTVSEVTLPRGRIGAVTFVDEQHGWATVSLGVAAGSEAIVIMRSNDGGTTWSQVAESGDPMNPGGDPGPSGISFGCDKGSAVFGSADSGVLPETCATNLGAIYRTRDAGAHWIGTRISFLVIYNQPVFVTSRDVFMVGDDVSSTRVLAFSHDAGATWEGQRLPGRGPVDFASVNSGWQLGNPIQATNDGGLTWQSLSVSTPAVPLDQASLQYLGNGTAAAWSLQTAFRTDDGGRTWQDVRP